MNIDDRILDHAVDHAGHGDAQPEHASAHGEHAPMEAHGRHAERAEHAEHGQRGTQTTAGHGGGH